jgi:hypothetical protein
MPRALLLLFLLSAPAAAPANAPDPAYLPELLAKARAENVAAELGWLRLGHWRRGLFGLRSEADGGTFFRAKGGKTDPAAELEATLAGFFDATPVADELDDAQCRFPARLRYLSDRLGIDAARLPPRACPKRDAFLARVAPQAATLVFSSYYLNNPTSAFGHTLLRLDKAGGARAGRSFELLDYGVDYAATVDTGNALLYAVKGLTGLFKGEFKHYAYYYKIRQYADAESRDLWEYDLALTQPEVELLARHLWELGGTWFDYWYLDENCSYHVLGAIDAAAPRLDLISNVGRFVVLPSDTVHALYANPGLVRAVHWRPSIRTQFEARLAPLSRKARGAVERLSRDPAAPVSLSPSETAAVLDAALDHVDMLGGKKLLLGQDPEALRRRQVLLERRAALRFPSPPLDLAIPEARRPDRGHASSRIGVGGGASRADGPTVLLDLRLALHDLGDPPPGYPALAAMEFLPMRFRYAVRDRKLRLDDLSVVRLVSFAPVSRFDLRPSWRGRFGATTVMDAGCDRCVAAVGEIGGGVAAVGLPGGLDVLATGDVELLGAPGLAGAGGTGARPGVGPTALARVRLGTRFAALAEGRWRWLPGAAPETTWAATGTLRLHLARNLSLSAEARTTPRDRDAGLIVLGFF